MKNSARCVQARAAIISHSLPPVNSKIAQSLQKIFVENAY